MRFCGKMSFKFKRDFLMIFDVFVKCFVNQIKKEALKVREVGTLFSREYTLSSKLPFKFKRDIM